jgi:hypothetical protein
MNSGVFTQLRNWKYDRIGLSLKRFQSQTSLLSNERQIETKIP